MPSFDPCCGQFKLSRTFSGSVPGEDKLIHSTDSTYDRANKKIFLIQLREETRGRLNKVLKCSEGKAPNNASSSAPVEDPCGLPNIADLSSSIASDAIEHELATDPYGAAALD